MTASDNHNHRVDIIDIIIPSPSLRTSSQEDRSSSSLGSWDNATDVLLSSWRHEAKRAAQVQTESYYFYQRIHNWITYPSILLSAFASIGTFATVHDTASLKFAIATSSFVSGTLVAINKHLRAAEKSQEHQSKSREFEKLVRDIDFITSQQRSEALVQLKADFERITSNQPQPPRRFKSFRNFIP